LRVIIARQGTEIASLNAWGDSIETQLGVARDTLQQLIVAIERYRWYADSTIDAQARQIVAMQVVVDTPRARRRWGFGGAAGYCSVFQRLDPGTESMRRSGIGYGPGVCAGVSFNL
jgi:hypothetical protein